MFSLSYNWIPVGFFLHDTIHPSVYLLLFTCTYARITVVDDGAMLTAGHSQV